MAAIECARRQIANQPKRNAFLFGCNAFKYRGDTPYASYFQGVFNYATLPFYLKALEPVEGQPNYRRIEEILAWWRAVTDHHEGSSALVGSRSGDTGLVEKLFLGGNSAALCAGSEAQRGPLL